MTRAEGESFRIAIGARRLHALGWGDPRAPAVFAIHGAGAHAHWWDELVPHLVDTHHVVAPDLRGHGESDWADGYLIEDCAADLLALIEVVSPPSPVDFVGHSMGGRVAAWLAAHQPERVRALVLLDARLGRVAPERAERWRGAKAPDAARRSYASRAEAEAAFRLTPREPGVAPGRHSALAAHAVCRLADGTWALRFDRRALGLDGSRVADLLPLAARIRCPTLVMRGADSTVIGAAQHAATAAAIPHAVMEVVPGGHHFLLASPAAVGTRVAAFLRDPT